jgi:hypothetical protein
MAVSDDGFKTIGIVVGEICEDSFMNTKGIRPAELDKRVADIARDLGIELDEWDPMFSAITPDQERAIYRELARRYLVRFEVDDVAPTETKRCSGCGRELPITEFYRRRRDHPARQARCKDCVAAYLVQYRLVPRNSEDIP